MKTRNIFLLLAACAFSVSAAVQTAESQALARSVPIADVHMHVDGGFFVGRFIDRMVENNVVYGGAVGAYSPKLSEALGQRYIAAIGQDEFFDVFKKQGPSGLTQLANFSSLFEKAERLFSEGKIRGFGEIHSDNHVSLPLVMQRKIRLRSPVIERMYEMANKYGGFVQIHSQYDQDFEADLRYLSGQYPNAFTVLSHCLPLSSPAILDRFFSEMPNVVCELSANGPVHAELGGRRARMYTSEGPRREWADLIRKHPDRIMLGTDPCCGTERRYPEMIKELRTFLLPYFELEVIEKLAYKNALTWFKISPAAGSR